MGVFTIYCPICGGPSYVVANDYPDENPGWNLDEKRCQWLGNIYVLTKECQDTDYITEQGYCNEYGVGHIIDQNSRRRNYCVCPLNHGNPKGEYADHGDGFLIHLVCYKLIQTMFSSKEYVPPSNLKLLEYFKEQCDDCSGICGFDYGGIEKNCAQFYQIQHGEEYFLVRPLIREELRTRRVMRIYEVPKAIKYTQEESEGILFHVPYEVFGIIKEYLTLDDMLSCCTVSKFFYNQMAVDMTRWKREWLEKYYDPRRTNDTEINWRKLLLKYDRSFEMKNHARIRKILKQFFGELSQKRKRGDSEFTERDIKKKK